MLPTAARAMVWRVGFMVLLVSACAISMSSWIVKLARSIEPKKTNHGDRIERGGVLHILTIVAEAMAMISCFMAQMACSSGTVHENVRGLRIRQE